MMTEIARSSATARKQGISNVFLCIAKLLSIAVMTCSYVYHLQSLRPMIRLIYDAHSFQHATAARACAWRATPLSFDVSFLENPCEYPHKLLSFILPETTKTRVSELHDSCYSIGLLVFTFTLLFSKAKKRCSGRALTRDSTVSF